jgi:hypothetical protein
VIFPGSIEETLASLVLEARRCISKICAMVFYIAAKLRIDKRKIGGSFSQQFNQ